MSSENDNEYQKARCILRLLIKERSLSTVEINKIIKLLNRSQDGKIAYLLENTDDNDDLIDESCILKKIGYPCK